MTSSMPPQPFQRLLVGLAVHIQPHGLIERIDALIHIVGDAGVGAGFQRRLADDLVAELEGRPASSPRGR